MECMRVQARETGHLVYPTKVMGTNGRRCPHGHLKMPPQQPPALCWTLRDDPSSLGQHHGGAKLSDFVPERLGEKHNLVSLSYPPGPIQSHDDVSFRLEKKGLLSHGTTWRNLKDRR